MLVLCFLVFISKNISIADIQIFLLFFLRRRRCFFFWESRKFSERNYCETHSKAIETKPLNYFDRITIQFDLENVRIFFWGVLFCPLCMIADTVCFWAHLMNLIEFLRRFSNQIRMSNLKCIQFDRGLLALNGSMCWQHMKSVRAQHICS